MHDPARVRRAQAARDLDGDVERRVDGKGPGAEARAQRLAFQALRHDVRGVVVVPDVVHGEHVRVVEGARGARLPLERVHPLFGVEGVRKQELDGHVAPEALVPRPPHLTHPARSQPPRDHVGADAIARPDAPPLARDLPRKDVEGWRREEVAGLVRRAQQRRDLVPQAGIQVARVSEEIRAAARGLLHRLREELLDAMPAVSGHGGPPASGRATPARTPSPSAPCGPR